MSAFLAAVATKVATQLLQALALRLLQALVTTAFTARAAAA